MSIKHIQNNNQLADCISFLEKTSAFALDLEFDKNRFRYGFNMCLMQIFANNQCFLIDPLSKDLDISLTFPLMENNEIEKVVFSFGEDLRLFHSLNCFPKNIYDTRIALSLLNYPPLSLSNSLEELLQVSVGKSAQMSNWFLRPLTEEQSHYAASDVLHLLELKDILKKEATDKGCLDWIVQENQLFSQKSYANTDNKVYLKEKDKKGMNEYQWFMYEQLMHFREEVAEQHNKPSHHIAPTGLLRDIAQNPSRAKNWSTSKGVMRSLKQPAFQQKLNQFIQEQKEEASRLGKSKTESAQKPMPPAEYQVMRTEMNLVEKEKKEIFKPIQEAIAQEYGENVAFFILSNRVMANITKGETEDLPPYKLELFQRFGADYGIDEILERG